MPCSPQLDLYRRAAFVLTQLPGYTYQQTVQICDCPIGTIHSRIARAREDLARHVRDVRLAG